MFALLRKLLTPYTRKILLVSGLAMVYAALGAVIPLLNRYIFDYVIPNKSVKMLIIISLGCLVLQLMQLGFNVVFGYKSTQVGELIKNNLQEIVYEAILRGSILKRGSRSTGDLMSAIDNDVSRLMDIVQTFMVSGMKDILVFIVCFSVISISDFDCVYRIDKYGHVTVGS
jgi:ABC-type bacteriocin/lantibiotic exporter with double-glycine peptidase domain